MERRKLKIIFNDDGKGRYNTKISLPSGWVQEQGITKEDREVNVYILDDKIIISKEEIEMNSWTVYVQGVKWEGSNWIGYGDNLEEPSELSYEEALEKYDEFIKEYEELAEKEDKNFHIDLRNMLDDFDKKSKDKIVGNKSF